MRLPVIECGSGSDVLLIHGIISDKSFFEGLMSEMKDCFHLIAYDRRGYGDSEKADDYAIESQAEDAAQVIRNYARGKTWIVGNSAGGMIALCLYLRFPELVRGMLLIEPSLVFDPESERLISEWNARLNGFVAEGRIKKALPAVSEIIGDESGESEKLSLKELKRIYKNLETFMLCELNDIQNFRPRYEEFDSINIPIMVLISEDGKDSIFAKTSVRGAGLMGWPVGYLSGYHNTLNKNPADGARRLKEFITRMEKTNGT